MKQAMFSARFAMASLNSTAKRYLNAIVNEISFAQSQAQDAYEQLLATSNNSSINQPFMWFTCGFQAAQEA